MQIGGQKREMWLIIKSNCVAINSSYHYWDLLSQYSWSSFAWREDYFHMWLRCNYLHPQAAEISELKCWLPGWECAATPHMTAPCLRGSSSHVSSCPAKTERKRGTSIITVTYTSLSVFTYIRRTTVGGNVFEWCRCSKKILIIFQSSMKRDKETVECHECQSGKEALNKLNFLWFIFDVWYVLKVRRKKKPFRRLDSGLLGFLVFQIFYSYLSVSTLHTHTLKGTGSEVTEVREWTKAKPDSAVRSNNGTRFMAAFEGAADTRHRHKTYTSRWTGKRNEGTSLTEEGNETWGWFFPPQLNYCCIQYVGK